MWVNFLCFKPKFWTYPRNTPFSLVFCTPTHYMPIHHPDLQTLMYTGSECWMKMEIELSTFLRILHWFTWYSVKTPSVWSMFLAFYDFIDRTVQRGDKKWDEREGGMTCSRGLQVSLQLWATAARTGPIFTWELCATNWATGLPCMCFFFHQTTIFFFFLLRTVGI